MSLVGVTPTSAELFRDKLTCTFTHQPASTPLPGWLARTLFTVLQLGIQCSNLSLISDEAQWEVMCQEPCI